MPSFAQRLLEAEIAHHRADHGTLERTVVLPGAREHVKQLIAVDAPPELIHHHDPIAVAVESQADLARTPGTVSCKSSAPSSRSCR